MNRRFQFGLRSMFAIVTAAAVAFAAASRIHVYVFRSKSDAVDVVVGCECATLLAGAAVTFVLRKLTRRAVLCYPAVGIAAVSACYAAIFADSVGLHARDLAVGGGIIGIILGGPTGLALAAADYFVSKARE